MKRTVTPYRCPFEILAPISPEDARTADIAGRTYTPLTITDGIGNGWATYYRKRSGSLKRLKRADLPVRHCAIDAEYDLIEYADQHHWLKRPRQED